MVGSLTVVLVTTDDFDFITSRQWNKPRRWAHAARLDARGRGSRSAFVAGLATDKVLHLIKWVIPPSLICP